MFYIFLSIADIFASPYLSEVRLSLAHFTQICNKNVSISCGIGFALIGSSRANWFIWLIRHILMLRYSLVVT